MPSLTWLDRTIGWISPVRGATRAQARAVMGAFLAYEGSKSGRRNDGWITTSNSADAEVAAALKPMRDRARDLVRNNPHAAKGLAVIVANKIGTGIMAQAAGPNGRVNKRIDERWKRWVDRCDITGQTDYYGLQSLAERTRCESGEVLIRKILTPKLESADDVPFRLQVLEPDFLDDSRDTVLDSGNRIRHGIEFNRNNAPVAYYLFDTHPGDNTGGSLRRGFESSRIPANHIIHYFKALRPGQTRGITDFAPVMLRLRDLDDWNSAKLMRAKVSACVMGVTYSAPPLPAAGIGPISTNADGKRQESFEPGLWLKGNPGDSHVFFDPKPMDDSGFVADELRAIAAGLGFPYELLSNDLSEVNYSSIRAGIVQYRMMVEAEQWQTTVPLVCGTVCGWFANELAGLDRSVDPQIPWVYTPPRVDILDPGKEIPAKLLAMQAGIESYPNGMRKEGYDWKEKLAEHRSFYDEVDRLGLTLTSDARTQVAAVSPAPEPAKPEPKPAEAA